MRHTRNLLGQTKPHLLALEPRMMFDAAAVATTDAVAHQAAVDPTERAQFARAFDSTDHAPAEASADRTVAERPAAGPAAAAATREIVFIDTGVADYKTLAERWSSRAEVVLIDGARDGVDQMRAALAGRSGVEAIHIVSHGASGVFFLGTTRVDSAAIAGDLSASLAAIGRSLTDDGDILIYGCDFAAGQEGADALHRFAAATGADVAASNDTTGAASRGDWDLESRDGRVEARALDGGDWAHTLDPNSPVPISVRPDSLTVTRADGTVLVSPGTGGQGYTPESNAANAQQRTADVGVGAVARWSNAATLPDGRAVDLKATVVALSAGDAIRFNRPGIGVNADDATFLLRDVTQNSTTNGNGASVEMRWELVLAGTDTPVPADVQFTIADIDGIGGRANTRETVSTSTQDLAYYTRERDSDVAFTSSLDRISASGTQNENQDPSQPITPKSLASFDWTRVSQWSMTYTLAANNGVTVNAQFFNDGDADFKYTDPVYVSVPRLDLDGDNDTAPGNDAHFTFTENGAPVRIVDADIVVSNPMPSNGITGGRVVLVNAKTGDTFLIGTLPPNITAVVGAGASGTITVTLTGNGSEADYAAAFQAITYRNTSENPNTERRVIQVEFSNDTLTSAVATSRIDVISVNDAPVARDDTASTNEDTAVTFNPRANDTDADGDVLTITAAAADNGTVRINPNGTITYTPRADFNGRDTIRYTISDGNGGTASAIVDMTVRPVNDAPRPVGTLPAQTAADRDTVRYETAGAFTDVEGDALTYSATGLPTGLTIEPGTGAIVGTIDRSASQSNGGVYTVVVTARDAAGAAGTQTFRLTVANPAPTASPDAAATDEDVPVTLDVRLNDNDPDGDPLSVVSAVADNGTVRINDDGTITYTPNAHYNGTDTIRYTISDGQGGTADSTVAVTIAARDDAPVVVRPLPDQSGQDARAVRFETAAGFADPDGDTLSYSATGLPPGLTIDAVTGVVSGLLGNRASQPNGGRYTVTVTADDGRGGRVDQTFVFTALNQPPVAVDDTASTIEETPVTIAVLANDSDPDEDLPLRVVAATAGRGTVVVNADNTLTYTPGPDVSGSDTIRYTIEDADGGRADAIVTVTIADVQDPPIARDDAATVAEDGEVTIPVLANDSDPDGDPLTIVAATADNGTVVRNPDGTLTYRPNADFAGSDQIRYTIDDGRGGRSSAVVAVTVAPVNDAPRPVGTLPPQAARDGEAVRYPTAAAFADPEGDRLVYAATGLPAGLAIDPATGEITGTIDRSASQADGGTYAVVVTATDPSGARGEQRFTLSVANPPPVARDDAVRTREDTPVTLDPRGNDADPDGDPLTVTAATADRGTVTINADGTITYSPGADVNGTDTIRYTISDGQGGTSQATVLVTIDPVDDAPRAVPIPRDFAVRDGLTVDLSVADAFFEPDGDPLAYAATGLPAGLSLDPVTGRITGTIDRSASQANGGRYPITITATDPQGNSARQDVTLIVVNPAPTAQDDAATTDEDRAVVIPVLANDTDPDGDPLTVTGATADHGTVAVNPDGTITYTPDADYNGPDTIRYAITDGQGGASAAIVAITVHPVNDAPDAAALPSRSDADSETVTVPTAAAFADRDGDRLTYSAAGLPAGLSIDPATGVVSGSIAPGSAYRGPAGDGRYPVTVTATDPTGASVATTFVWTVGQVAPVARDDAFSTDEDTAVTLPVLANDTDGNADPLTIVAATATGGTVRIDGDRLVFTPARDFNGTATVTYTVADPAGNRATATATVAVRPVNDAPVATRPLPTAAASDAQPVRLDLGGYFADADGDPLAFSATGLPPGLSIDPATGSIAGTVDRSASAAGPYRVTVTATDPSGARVASAFDWIVVNPAPSAADDTATTAEDTPVTIDVLANDGDPDGDPLRVVAATAANGTVTVDSGGTITYTPTRDFSGQDVIRYTIDDGNGGRATASVLVTVTPVPDAPVGTPPAPTRTIEGATVAIAPLFRDPDGEPLAYAATGLPAGLSIDPATGRITGTIAPGAALGGQGGIYRATVTATDPTGRTAQVPVEITVVDEAPALVAQPAPVSTIEGRAIDVAPAFRDPEGAPLAYTATGLPAGVAIDPATGRITGAPAAGSAIAVTGGRYPVTVTATDPNGNAATATFDIVVVDEAPALVAQPAPLSTIEGRAIDVAPAFRDPEGAPLAYTATGLPAGVAIDAATGRITGAPAAGSAIAVPGGRYPVTVTATDPNGNVATATFDIVVVDEAPAIVAQPAPVSTIEGRAIDVAPAFRDPEGAPLAYTATGLPAGVAIDAATGRITGAPAAGSAIAVPGGRYPVTVTATDPNGNATTTSFDIVVVDEAPALVAQPAPVPTIEGRAIDVAPAFRDPEGAPLAYTATGLPAGVAIDPATGRITGAPAAGSAVAVSGGRYPVTVTATDPNGNAATTSFDIVVVDRPPVVAVPVIAGTVAEGAPVTIDAAAAFSDPEGGPLRYAAAGLPDGVAIDPATGRITGTPARGTAAAAPGGVYRVPVTATDASGNVATAMVEIAIVNRPPVALDDVALTREDERVRIAVLANDADPGGDPLTIVSATAANGTVTIEADGTLTYVPGADFAGTDRIRYTISDGQGGTAEAIVEVVVTAVNDAPVVPGRDPLDAVAGRPLVIDGLAGIRDPDGDPLTIVSATAGNGTVTIGPDGALVFTPTLGFAGATTITYIVSDGQGGTATATLVVRVTGEATADICQLLEIGRVRFPNVPAFLALGSTTGEFASPMIVGAAVEGVRLLNGTAIAADRPVLDAVNRVRWLRGSGVDPSAPVAGEVARLAALSDFRDAGDRLFDRRWSDFVVAPLSGFSAAADGNACVMVESVVRGGAIYLEVRDIAADGRAGIRSVEVFPAAGDAHPDWLRVDPRGLAIVERGADMDELHLKVRVVRDDGRVTVTRIVVQGATGEVELDRAAPRRAGPPPLHATIETPEQFAAAEAARIQQSFQ